MSFSELDSFHFETRLNSGNFQAILLKFRLFLIAFAALTTILLQFRVSSTTIGDENIINGLEVCIIRHLRAALYPVYSTLTFRKTPVGWFVLLMYCLIAQSRGGSKCTPGDRQTWSQSADDLYYKAALCKPEKPHLSASTCLSELHGSHIFSAGGAGKDLLAHAS